MVPLPPQTQCKHHPGTSCWGHNLCHLPRVNSRFWWYTQTGLPPGTTAGCIPHQQRHFDSVRNSLQRSAGIGGPGYKLHPVTQWARAKSFQGNPVGSLLLISSEEESTINLENCILCNTWNVWLPLRTFRET